MRFCSNFMEVGRFEILFFLLAAVAKITVMKKSTKKFARTLNL
jgi:hypothetical protein